MAKSTNLRRARIKNTKLTIGQVVALEGFSKSYISDLETGAQFPSSWETLRKLAVRYKTSADYILELIDEPLPIQRKQIPSATLSVREEGATYEVDAIQELIWLMRDLPEEKQKAILDIAKVVKGLNS